MNSDYATAGVLACLLAVADIMAAAMAAPDDPGLQPQPMSNWSAFFYFAAFVLVVAYTLLNLYIGESRIFVVLPGQKQCRLQMSTCIHTMASLPQDGRSQVWSLIVMSDARWLNIFSLNLHDPAVVVFATPHQLHQLSWVQKTLCLLPPYRCCVLSVQPHSITEPDRQCFLN